MTIRFHKMHGAGNDFVLLDLRSQRFTLDAQAAVRLADRRTGVGCDQLLALHAPADKDASARIEIRNADGGRAEQCGNGMRCIALYLAMAGEDNDGICRLETPAGEVITEYLGNGQVRVNMGKPAFDPEHVPVRLAGEDGLYRLGEGDESLEFGAVSMGNPHAVVRVDQVNDPRIEGWGAWLGASPAFPQGCNAGFAEVLDQASIRLRVFERGAGETPACGSGACAAMAVLHRRNEVNSKVRVLQAGGELIIGWDGRNGDITLTGPAVHVFEGTLDER